MTTAWPLLEKIEEILSRAFQLIPQPSIKIQKILINALPLTILIIGMISVFFGLTNLFFKVIRVVFSSPEFLTSSLVLTTLVSIMSGFALMKSYPYLRRNKTEGWMIVFATTIVLAGINAVTNPFGLIQSFLFLYILFSVRKQYHGS